MSEPRLSRTSRGPRSLPPVFVLGGHQTDFARNLKREGLTIADLVRETALGAIESTDVLPREIEAAHVGNFIAELYTGQSHLGGLVADAHPDLEGAAISRHEAACASGGVAMLAAMADIQAGRYDCALVLGVELMRVLPGFESQQKLGAAARVPSETEGVAYPWPELFSHIAEEYDHRYGLRREHLGALARQSYENARKNPNAQTRNWDLPEGAFRDDDKDNPVIAGRTRRYDASPVTDGGAGVVLASAGFAEDWARRRGKPISSVARFLGYGHRTARMGMKEKLEASRREPYVFPHARGAALGVYNTLQSLGSFAGGAVGGWLTKGVGMSGLFGACAALMLVWLVVAWPMQAPPARQATPEEVLADEAEAT